MMHYVYILECEDGSYYTGYTTDPKRRIDQHFSGKGAKYTRSHKPIRMVYLEKHDEKKDAMSREWHIKHLSRREKEILILTSIENQLQFHHNDDKEDQ